jgi:uncharacterized membrane protein YjjP (DUF1212 family)
MKTFLKITIIAFVAGILTVACDTKPSLQKYYVDSKENNAFISVDLPANIIELKDENVTEEVKNTLKTIKKVNFLALQVDETNQELYNAEKEKVTEILKNPDYKQLMRFKTAQGNVTVNYLGTEDAINEVIIFGSDSKRGFALVRVLGENMNPADIMGMAQEIKLDGNSQQFKQISGLLGSMK